MKYLILLLLIVSVSCTKKDEQEHGKALSEQSEMTTMESDEDAMTEGEALKNDESAAPQIEEEAVTTGEPEEASEGIVEENDACICTKDYRPVCGSNGVTYPNACQAECENVEEYTEGPCDQ